MEVRILGPVEVRTEHGTVHLGPQQTALLIILVLASGRPVPACRLIDLLWNGAEPAGAATTLRSHVLRLRRALGVGTDVLALEGTGEGAAYRLDLEPEGLDAARFERLLAGGEQALEAGDPERAAEELRAGLDLWRGAALAGATSHPFAVAAAARLERLRDRARRARWRAELAVGRHGQLSAELEGSLEESPDDEELRCLVALTRYRNGHREEAAAICRAGLDRARRAGLDSPRLQRMQRDVLRADPALEWVPPEPVRPCNLPPNPARFAGRSDELEELTALLCPSTGPRWDGPVPVAVVFGKPGAGKTALALRVAHTVGGRYLDGQLFVDLRGTRDRPADPQEVLAFMLGRIGVAASAIPRRLDERCAVYRERLAQRRMLIVLDDAASELQIRHLLPSRPGCAVIVTSRSGLFGLDGARHLRLDVLDQPEAVELLGSVAGAERVTAEPSAAADIAELAGRLPLALRILGARLAARPHLSLSSLAAQLAEDHRRLDQISFHDMEMRASFALSYEALAEADRRAFRRLGLPQVPDFAPWAGSALLDEPVAATEERIETLVDAQLLEVAGQDSAGQTRYKFHDLLRLYAWERAEQDDPPEERHLAIRRWLDGCLGLAQEAAAHLSTGYTAPPAPVPGWRLPDRLSAALVADPLRLLEAEGRTLRAAITHATAEEPDLAWSMAAALSGFFARTGAFVDWRHTHTQALTAARRAGDRRGQAIVLCHLGELETRQDRYAQALGCFEGADELFRSLDDVVGEAAVAAGLGSVHRIQGRYELALEQFHRALRLCEGNGDEPGAAYARHGIGSVRFEQGRLDDARRWMTLALARAREAGHPAGEALELRGLALIELTSGDPCSATGHLERSQRLSMELGDRQGVMLSAQWLASLMIEQGQLERAEAVLHQCHGVFLELGDRFGQALTLHSLGLLRMRSGDHLPALISLEDAGRIWRELGSPYWQARTLDAIATAHLGVDGEAAARSAQDQAAAIRAMLGWTGPEMGSGAPAL